MTINIRPSLAAVLVGSKEELIERAKRFDEAMPGVHAMVEKYERGYEYAVYLWLACFVLLGLQVAFMPTWAGLALYVGAVIFCTAVVHRFKKSVNRERNNCDELIEFRFQLIDAIKKA